MQKLKTLIGKLSTRYYFWYILIFYNLLKLCPVIHRSKIPTYTVACIAFLYLGVKILNDLITGNYKRPFKIRILTILIVFFAVISYLVDSKFNINLLFKRRDFILLGTYFINFLAIFTLCRNENDEEKNRFLYNSFNIITIFSFIYGLISIIYAISTGSVRVDGFSSNVYNYSEFVVPAFATSLYLSLNCKNNFKYFYIFNCFLQFAVLLFNQQRAAYVGFFIATVILIYLLYKYHYLGSITNYCRNNKKIVLCISIFFVVFFVILMRFINLSVLFEKLKEHTGSGRLELWQTMFSAFFKNNVIFGYGGSTYTKMSEFLGSNPLVSDGTIYYAKSGYAHNIFFAALFDFGIIGLILVLAFVFKLLKVLISYYKVHNNDSNKTLLLVIPFFIIAPLVIGQFDENIIIIFAYLPNTLFFIFASFLFENEYRKQ